MSKRIPTYSTHFLKPVRLPCTYSQHVTYTCISFEYKQDKLFGHKQKIVYETMNEYPDSSYQFYLSLLSSTISHYFLLALYYFSTSSLLNPISLYQFLTIRIHLLSYSSNTKYGKCRPVNRMRQFWAHSPPIARLSPAYRTAVFGLAGDDVLTQRRVHTKITRYSNCFLNL